MSGCKHEWYFDECIHCGSRRLPLRGKRPVIHPIVAKGDAVDPLAAMTADRDAWAAESADNLRKLVAATARIDAMRDDIITLGEQINSLMRERDAALAQVVGAYEAAAQALEAPEWSDCGCMDAGCRGRHAEKLEALEFAAADIRAMTPADATAALDRIKRQARIEGLQQAYDLSGGYHQVTHIRAAILAAIKGEELL